MFDFLSYFLLGMILIFALVAGAGMANAILLSVQDRSKDLGTLRAIALSSRSTAILVGIETFIVSVLAALCAMLLCSLVLWLMERSGVNLVFELSSGKETVFPKIIRPVFLPLRVGIISCLCALFPLIATIFPMRVASQLTIREALSA
jgi:putative ABC transport system permease protein